MKISELMGQNILSNMTEGVLAISFDGNIVYANNAACRMLGKKRTALEGSNPAIAFMEFPENDRFNQQILEAIYDREKTHRAFVDYYDGVSTKKLRISSSFYTENQKTGGVILVFSDVSEFFELKDAVKAMEKIQELNSKLKIRNKLLGETFGRYLSDAIVSEILDSPDGLQMGGKKMHLSVMMSDLRGFSALSEIMSPKDLVSMLNHYLGKMTEIVASYKGTIIEFIGDGILAIFGAPLKTEDYASKALAAALSMQNAMHEVNAWNEEQGYPTLEMGVGIHTGDMIVGNIGSERHAKYGVVGSNVNFAGRLESYTTEGQVFISEETLNNIKWDVKIEETVMINPKGFNRTVPIYRVSSIEGPYSVSFFPEGNRVLQLKEPIEVSFYLMDGKFIQQEEYKGTITAMSEKKAVLKTDTKLRRFDNISLNAESVRSAKVTKTTENGSYELEFTSPEESK